MTESRDPEKVVREIKRQTRFPLRSFGTIKIDARQQRPCSVAG